MNASHSPQVTGWSARAKRAEVGPVAGQLVVEAESPARRARSRGSLPDTRSRCGCGRRRRFGHPHGVVGRQQRIARQDVLDVHQQELLVLLLVLDAELDQRRRRPPRGLSRRVGHGLVDVGPVLGDLLDPGPGQQPPVVPRIPGAHALVVGVEQVAEVGMEGSVPVETGDEQEGLEEPGGVGPVPLGRAHVGHGLDGLVLGRQGGGERLGERPGGEEPVGDRQVAHGHQQIRHTRSSGTPWGSSRRLAGGSGAPSPIEPSWSLLAASAARRRLLYPRPVPLTPERPPHRPRSSSLVSSMAARHPGCHADGRQEAQVSSGFHRPPYGPRGIIRA